MLYSVYVYIVKLSLFLLNIENADENADADVCIIIICAARCVEMI